MKAILIARVSTDDQADALPAQVYKLTDYALKNDFDFELVKIQESAYSGDRIEFNKVLSSLSHYSELVVLVFDKVDRYSRDPSSPEVRTLNALCKQGKIELHFPSDNLVITKDASASQWLMLSLNTSFSQYYSNSISDNVRRRNDQLRRDGIWTGKAPKGYINTVKDGKKWIDISPIEAQAVKEAFEMYASGMTTLKLIRDFWYAKYNIVSTVSHVDVILKNPFYYGVMRVKGNLYEHHYDRIVAKEIFQECERVRNGYKSKPNSVGGLPFPYRGVIRCADCGCLVTFELKKGKYKYGHCSQFKGKHGAEYVREEELTSQFEKILKKIVVPDDVMKQILDLINEDKHILNATRDAKISTIRAEIARYNTRIDKLYDDHVDGKIDDTLYGRKKSEYESKLATLSDQQSIFELSGDGRYETVSHLLDVAKNAHKIFSEADYLGKRKILKKVLSNSQLSGKSLLLELKKPYNLMAFCSENSSWQGHVESNHGPRFWRPIY